MAESPVTRVPVYLSMSLIMSMLTLAAWVGGQSTRLSAVDVDVDRLNVQMATEATALASLAVQLNGEHQLMYTTNAQIAERVKRLEDQLDRAASVAGRKR